MIPFRAHKYVLSAFSPFLKNILLDNHHAQPLIYLRGVKHQELESILQFIYLGEASFYHGNMNRFIQAAKDLQIKQLSTKVSNIPVTSVDIRQQHRAVLRFTNNPSMKVSNITATSVNIRQQHRAALRLAKNLSI